MSDPATYYFTQGVLGVSVIVLGLVIRVLWLEVKKERAEKEAILKAWREETKTDGQVAIDVLKGNSQSLLYLADKIQTAKTEGQTQ